MKLLCIADTHGRLQDDWYNGEEYDLCLMLGDHSLGDAEKVLKFIPKERIRAIYGNHDVPIAGRTPIDYFDLPELKYEEINGVRFLGVGGSLRYKRGPMVAWEQFECAAYMDIQPEADVLITHDLAYWEINQFIVPKVNGVRLKPVTLGVRYNIPKHPAHIGLKGFSDYLKKYPKCKHIHGHVHRSYAVGNTRSVYMVEMVEI